MPENEIHHTSSLGDMIRYDGITPGTIAFCIFALVGSAALIFSLETYIQQGEIGPNAYSRIDSITGKDRTFDAVVKQAMADDMISSEEYYSLISLWDKVESQQARTSIKQKVNQ